MDTNDILKRRRTAEVNFSNLTKQRAAKQAELTEIEAEMNRLQGEHRILVDLLPKTGGDYKPAETEAGDATTIDARKVKGA